MKTRFQTRTIVVACFSLLASATPSAAQLRDPMEMTTDPADKAVIAEVASIISSGSPAIAQLDAVLKKLPRPTPLRGIVQTFRAIVLAREKDLGPAVAAIEEALRLLPDDPRPKLSAVGIFTFSGSPQRAADLWMQASFESPEVARASDPYLMSALNGRLLDLGDQSRADRVNARLGAIGFSAGPAPARSSSALSRAREALRNERIDEALEAVTSISNPSDLLTLYADRRYAVLWPRISEWAGADLEGQEGRYLEELHHDWRAANDFTSATVYARRLYSFGAYSVVTSLFLPMFDRPPGEVNPSYEDDAEFLAPIVAQSLSRLGRKADALTLLAKVARALPLEDGAGPLNIDTAYLILEANDLNWAQVVTLADSFLSRVRAPGDDVNYSAVVQVQAKRACALSRLGRIDEAQQASAIVLGSQATMPDAAMDLHLCRGDADSAKSLLTASLEGDENRSWALHFVQPSPRAAATPYEKLIRPVTEAILSDPAIRKIANRVGRILSRPLGAQLPAGFDPFQAPSRTRPVGPNDT